MWMSSCKSRPSPSPAASGRRSSTGSSAETAQKRDLHRSHGRTKGEPRHYRPTLQCELRRQYLQNQKRQHGVGEVFRLSFDALSSMERVTADDASIARQIAKRDFPRSLIFRIDEAEPEQEASECVLLVVGRSFGSAEPFLIPCHFAQLADEGVAGIHLVRVEYHRKPGKSDLHVGDFRRQFVNIKGFFNETARCR